MKSRSRTILAVLSILWISAAVADDRGKRVTRVGPEPAVGGITAEETAARQAQLHQWLMAERPAGTLDTPIRVDLTPEERSNLAKPRPKGEVPLQIGLVKSVSPAFDFAGLQPGLLKRGAAAIAGGVLQRTDDGGFIWSRAVTSPGAEAIRVQFQGFSLPDAADLYFYTLDGQIRGPYQRQGPNRDGTFWSNSIRADTGVIALRFFGEPTAQELRDVSFRITAVGHIGRGPRPDPEGHTWSHDQCGNASCVVDANCGSVAPADQSAIAKMEWIQGAFIFTCTGGLIADTDTGSQRNLFLTANHCLKASRDNLETFFAYTTSSCNGSCPGSPAPDTTGAIVLESNRKGDYTLMELSQNPPGGSTFLGWNNSPIAFTEGADLYRVSNPNFGPQVFSHHTVDTNTGTCTQWPRGERIYSADVEGATDGGSSGSPVVNSSGEIVGQLSGCCGFNCGDVCDSGSNATVDGALAFYYDDVAQFLDPSGGGCSSDPECDDGLFCNGAETCVGGSCQGGSDPCPGEGCDEGSDQCVSCTLLPPGASCTDDTECCSNKCKGPPSNKTCR